MEGSRDDLVVILAGYRDRMETLLGSKPGMKSRIAHHLDFPDFDLHQLLLITEVMLSRLMYQFSASAREVFSAYLTRRMTRPHFANARSVRDALDRIRLRPANRLVRLGRPPTEAEPRTTEPEDILQSRVCAAGDGPALAKL